ncbi:UV DNA damage repair endonuclease UvsE [Paenibacillus sp. GCM10012307]|uniref:UV DNA damage repair endonuclease UvsE n=1 Tax=Paenibacillus roseus TaxID=2798579 RepID=A0A934J0X2_9BACL|nr:UV DNA damage repair endonuclease UvsE [Paenibacillus roseus]MBJ6362792.1 UV DNA damage repair endonuclease UvsE [Paenibacillus roseus]
MIVRFGFVAMSMMLEHASVSRTMTYQQFSRLADRGAALRKLERIATENLEHTLRLLKHCYAHDVRVYRFSSKLIPLATHGELRDWDPYPALQENFAKVSAYIREKGFRVSFHPDHFCVLNTPRPEVLESSIRDLEYHVRMLEAMGLDERTTKCNIHVGGAYGDKEAAGERFIRQFADLSARYRNRITLENDDKTFTAKETLEIAEASSVPMVLDIHHHAVNDGGMSMEAVVQDLWPRIARTWETADGPASSCKALPPKIHASSPKNNKDVRSHADLLDPVPLLRFLQEISGSVPRLDVMLEAKQKDIALFRLMDELRKLERDGGFQIVDGATIEV